MNNQIPTRFVETTRSQVFQAQAQAPVPEAPPPYTPVDTKSEIQKANSLYEQISSLPESFRKNIIDRLISIHNTQSVDVNNQIHSSQSRNEDHRIPLLNAIITELVRVLEPKDVAKFAFYSGHFSDFIRMQQEHSNGQGNNNVSHNFFRCYFQKVGSINGLTQLYNGIQAGLINNRQKSEDLSNYLTHVKYEEFSGTNPRPDNPQFDYSLVTTLCLPEFFVSDLMNLSIKLNFTWGFYQELQRRCYSSEHQLMEVLHAYACNGGTVLGLITALEEIGQRRIAGNLHWALQSLPVMQPSVAVATGSNPNGQAQYNLGVQASGQ